MDELTMQPTPNISTFKLSRMGPSLNRFSVNTPHWLIRVARRMIANKLLDSLENFLSTFDDQSGLTFLVSKPMRTGSVAMLKTLMASGAMAMSGVVVVMKNLPEVVLRISGSVATVRRLAIAV